MPAVEANELAERAHARVFAWLVRAAPQACVHSFQRGLSEQALNQPARRRLIEHEPVVSRQSHPESAQITEVSQTVDQRRHEDTESLREPDKR